MEEVAVSVKKFYSKKKRRVLSPETFQEPKKAKLEAPEEPKNFINKLFNSEGFNHITEKILCFLDHKNQLTCRFVCHSWKDRMDRDPYFWIQKCDKKGQTKELHNAWIKLIGEFERNLRFEKDLTKLLMKWHGNENKGLWEEDLEVQRCGVNDFHQVDHDVMTPLFLASEFGHIDVLKRVGSYTENFNISLPFGQHHQTPLYLAANNGHVDVFKYLAQRIDNPNQFTVWTGETTMDVAAENGHLDIVKILAPMLENPNAYTPTDGHIDMMTRNSINSRDSSTPLHRAAEGDHIEVVKFLLSKVENPNVECELPDFSGWHPMHCAVFAGSTNVVKFLASTLEDPFKPLPDGQTPMHLAARSSQGSLESFAICVEITKILLKRFKHSFKRPNACRNDGMTPFHLAIKNGNIAFVKTFMMFRPKDRKTFTFDPFQPLPDGRSVIKFAADNGQSAMVKIFLDEAYEKHNRGVIRKFSKEVCKKTESISDDSDF